MKNHVNFIRFFGIALIVLVCIGVKILGDVEVGPPVTTLPVEHEIIEMPSQEIFAPSTWLQKSAELPCKELYEHLSYWKTDTIGIGDVKGIALQAACDLTDPCTSLEVHNEYWHKRGHKSVTEKGGGTPGADPVRWGLLKAACESKKFLGDLASGKVPAAFQLAGRISGELRKIPKLLSSVNKTVSEIPATFAMMYEQLGLNQPVIAASIKRLEVAKKQVDEMLDKISNDPKVTPKLKQSLASALTALQQTLPKIQSVLTQLREEIGKLIQLRPQKEGESIDEYRVYVKATARVTAQNIQGAVDKVVEAINRNVTTSGEPQSLAQVIQKIADVLSTKNL